MITKKIQLMLKIFRSSPQYVNCNLNGRNNYYRIFLSNTNYKENDQMFTRTQHTRTIGVFENNKNIDNIDILSILCFNLGVIITVMCGTQQFSKV